MVFFLCFSYFAYLYINRLFFSTLYCCSQQRETKTKIKKTKDFAEQKRNKLRFCSAKGISLC